MSLTWAGQQRLTVVRVLAMGQGFMNLSPSEGRQALPRLLQMRRNTASMSRSSPSPARVMLP